MNIDLDSSCRIRYRSFNFGPFIKRLYMLTCGTSSTSNSPDKYWRSNSLFSPTYEDTIRLICLVLSKIPRPKLSTPALLLTHVKPLAVVFDRAPIKFSGIPHSPKPPTSNLESSGMSLTASAAFEKISTNCGLALISVGVASNVILRLLVLINYFEIQKTDEHIYSI